LIENVIPEIVGQLDTGMLDRASITEGGSLTSPYEYLLDYLAGAD